MIKFCIQDLNFEKEIGANCLFLQLGPFQFIIDAGMDPKRVGNSVLPQFDLLKERVIDSILLTHSHLDHLGSLPILRHYQQQAKILLTYPTSLVAPVMLKNSYKVMCRQKEEQKIFEYPLYDKADIEDLKKVMLPVSFGRPQRFEKEGRVAEITFFPAGHVLGAASILIACEGRKVLITGDVLFQDQIVLKGANIPQLDNLDTIVLETTRGKTVRRVQRTDEEERLLTVISNTLEGGGACLIPAFALGRIQEMLMLLYRARVSKKVPNCPIFCSGLGMSLVDIFDAIGKTTRAVNFDRKLLKQLNVRSLGKRKINPESQLKAPAIYLLSSGMLVEHTPSYKVAANLVQDSKNSICFVGYCDPDTPGGQLLQAPSEEIFTFKSINFSTPLRAKVEHFDLSGHADREDLYRFVLEQKPRQVILTHGDEEARQWFFDQFKNDASFKVIDPVVGTVYAI